MKADDFVPRRELEARFLAVERTLDERDRRYDEVSRNVADRLEAINHFRAEYSDEVKRLLPKNEYDIRHKQLSDRLTKIEDDSYTHVSRTTFENVRDLISSEIQNNRERILTIETRGSEELRDKTSELQRQIRNVTIAIGALSTLLGLITLSVSVLLHFVS